MSELELRPPKGRPFPQTCKPCIPEKIGVLTQVKARRLRLAQASARIFLSALGMIN